jgi:heme/copper-type cytochrome/quinol oxidase subunit 3
MILNVPLATLNTFILISSSVTVVLAWANLRLGNLRKGKIFLTLTLLCGLGFMIIKAIEYGTKFSHGQFPNKNNFFATYYLMTGLHGLHVTAGLALMLVILGRLAQGAYRDGDVDGPRAISYYWHLVDVVWVGLFLTLYVLR